jgi:FixJ family two-component response regulator
VSNQESVVFVVDDDAAMRESINCLFRSVGLHTMVFASAAEFLQNELPDALSCLVLDVRMPGLSGLELQARLAQAKNPIPVVFMTGHGDIPMTVKAMKAGAVEFLQKPFRVQDMLDAVRLGIERDRLRRETEKSRRDVQAQFATLTPRERDVMALAASGLMNKQIAGELGITATTVKVHRRGVMEKMHAKSLPDLMRKAELLGTPTRSQT